MTNASDPFDLQRFIHAQNPVYDNVVKELGGGTKQSHWVWFIFPQVEGLGHSSMARRFAIKSRSEAVAYLGNLILGTRLLDCTKLVLTIPDKTASDIFGSPDDAKFRSSMTLFEAVAGGPEFGRALDRFFDGKRDQPTLDILQRWAT